MEERFKIVHSGREYFSVLQSLISSATTSIHIFIYTIVDDETGREVVRWLSEAVERGVEVHFLADSFGSKDLTEEFREEIIKAGIHFRVFSPYLTGNVYSLGRRLHMKLVLTDERYILIGGINFSNNYNDVGGKAWRDYAVSFASEEVGRELARIHESVYEKKLSRKIYERFRLRGDRFEVLINDWLLQTSSIQKTYDDLVDNSEEEIIIMISYFIPGNKFLRRLAAASKRGVKIIVINSEQWDIPFMGKAIHYLYPWMERHGIILYEWKPSVLHAKVMIVDGVWCLLGSFNLNGLSRYNSLEMNVVISDTEFVQKLRGEIEELVIDERQMKRINHYRTNWLQQFANWISYRIVRISLSIMFLLIKEERNRRGQDTD